MDAQITPPSQAPPAPKATEPTVTPLGPPKPISRRDRIKKANLPHLIPPVIAPPPKVVDETIEPEDLLLEFSVRIRRRESDVFQQSRKVAIWKGASASGTNRYMAAAEIGAQLQHLVQTVQVVMKQHTAEVDTPPPLPRATLTSPLEVLPVTELNTTFVEEIHEGMPDLDSEA